MCFSDLCFVADEHMINTSHNSLYLNDLQTDTCTIPRVLHAFTCLQSTNSLITKTHSQMLHSHAVASVFSRLLLSLVCPFLIKPAITSNLPVVPAILLILVMLFCYVTLATPVQHQSNATFTPDPLKQQPTTEARVTFSLSAHSPH